MTRTPLADVRDKLRRTYHAMLESGGATSPQIVMRFKADHPSEFEGTKDQLAELGLGVLVRGLLRTPSAQLREREQLELPLELRAFVPGTISVPTRSNEPDGAARDVRWIAFRSATFSDFEAHLGLLADSVDADLARLRGLYRIRDLLAPVMNGRSAMTIGEGLKALKKNSKRDAA